MGTVVVVGLALTGEALVKHLVARGEQVIVIEDSPPGTDEYRARVEHAVALGASVVEAPSPHATVDLVGAADLVVPSPGVPERHAALAEARRRALPVRSEIDLAAEASTGGPTIVAVTGTNGKTTVTTLVAAMLAESGVPTVAAGNIGHPLIEAVYEDVAVVVAEVSSFQLAFTDVFRPRAAALLNLGSDHLDWHRTFDAYAQAKAKVFAHQHHDDLLVFNADDPVVAGLAATAPGRCVAFSLARGAASGYRLAETVQGQLLLAPDGEQLASVEELPRRSPPDLANALAAAALALDVGATADAVRAVLGDFEGLPHRMQTVAEHRGVRYVDDSKATNPHATIAALSGSAREGSGNVVLVAGGRNKGLDLRELTVLAPALRGVVAIGESADEVVDAFSALVPVALATSMHDAVRAGARLARTGDDVVLSPACASFDWYLSYAERGDDFAREVHELVEVEG